MRSQDPQRRLHCDEDRREEDHHLENWAVAVAVRVADILLGERPREERRDAHHDFSDTEGKQGCGQYDHSEEEEVDSSVQSELQVIDRDTPTATFAALVLLEIVQIDQEVNADQNTVDHQPLRPQLERPREGNAAQEAQEKRGVTERGQQTTGIRHDEDEEDRQVLAILGRPVLVHREKRSDEHHRGARRADHTGEHRSQAQQCCIAHRVALHLAFDEDATGDDEQTAQQCDEGVVLHAGVLDHVPVERQEINRSHGGDGPHHHELVLGVLPPVVGDQGHSRNETEHQDEWCDRHHGDLGVAHVVTFRFYREAAVGADFCLRLKKEQLLLQYHILARKYPTCQEILCDY